MKNEFQILLKSPPIIEKNSLWVDDSPMFIEQQVSLVKKFADKSIVVITNAEDAVQYIENNDNDSLYMFDLDMDNPHINGVTLHRLVRMKNKLVPVRFVTANRNFPVWSDRIKVLENEISEKTITITKPFGIVLNDVTPTPIKQSLAEKILYEKIISNPYKLTCSEFYNTTIEQRIELFKVASELVREEVREYFTKTNLKYLVLAEIDDNICVVASENIDRPLDDNFLTLISDSLSKPVFGFKAPKMIEEYNSSWEEFDDNDYYPSVSFKLDSTIYVKGHFDTGNPFSFISYKYLLSNGFKFPFYINTSEQILWNKSYQFYEFTNHKAWIKSIDEKDEREILIDFEAVINWDEIFLRKPYTNRISLIGRNIIIKNNLMVVFNGQDKETYFIKNIEQNNEENK